MGNQVTIWNNDEVKTLKALAGKVSNTKIAEKLGRTRHSVKNKIDRMGLPRFNSNDKTEPILEVNGLLDKAIQERKKRSTVFQYGKVLKPKVPQESQSQIEWCPACYAAVSNWQEHFERRGHRRPVK